MKASIILPTYKEKDNIVELIGAIFAARTEINFRTIRQHRMNPADASLALFIGRDFIARRIHRRADSQPPMNVSLQTFIWLALTSAAVLIAGCGNESFTATAVSEQSTPLEPTPAIFTFPTLTRPPRVPTATRTPTPIPPTPILTIQPVGHDEVEMVEIPAGEFIMGLTLEQATTLNERLQWEYLQTYHSNRSFTPLDASIPQMTVYLDSFKIDVLEVTQARYTACIAAGICQPPPVIYIPGEDNPISVSQAAAQTYCKWVGKRLPTEVEWEKAARGTNGRIFPWGDQWDEKRVALTLSPVGSHPQDVSPYGVLDMAGNSDEWTLSPDQAYPSHPNPALFSSNKWIVRGHLDFPTFLWAGAVTAWRQGDENISGFRCVEGTEPVPVAEAVVTYQPAVPPPPPTATAVAVSEMVEIPAGPFLRGMDEQAPLTDDERRLNQDTIPQRSVYLDSYYIDRFPVTVAQFAEFLNALGQHRWACNGWHCANLIGYLQYEDKHYQVPEETAALPFPFATWYGAEAYCAWRGKRLPTEAEWEKAARGTDGRRYPWGNEWDPRAAEDKNSQFYARYPVGEKPYLSSPYGVQDLVSIVPTGEWVADWYAEDYYARADSTNNPQGPAEGEQKVRRGSDRVRLGGITARYPVSELNENIADFRCAYTPPGTH